MDKQDSYHATIASIPDGEKRPLWSVVIPTYNCAEYLRETLASVLAQDPGPEVMQILVVDDHSTKDDPQAVVTELGQGRVEFYRQAENVGNTKNYATGLHLSRGKIIHLLHGDDCVLYGFYSNMQQAFEKAPEIGAAFCRHIFMDEQSHWLRLSTLEQLESGILNNWLERIATIQIIQTPSIVVRREVYEKLGGFDQRLRFTEDWEMWTRVAANYPVWYEVEPLALYRERPGSITKLCLNNGDNVRQIYKAIDIFKLYLPEEIISKARKKNAIYLFKYTSLLLECGANKPAIIQMKALLKFYNSYYFFAKVFLLFVFGGTRWVLRKLSTSISFSCI
ncbi:hypothetical protein CAL7716_044480 [Calothrix sp. PCC 7716]|nr:hypothetical protein CAL7716_044480 [Calothrix sp. PCC 7716]